MLHGRLPWLHPDEMSADQRKLADAIVGGPRGSVHRSSPMTTPEGRLHGPFNAMLIDPVVGQAVQELGAAVRYGAKLEGRAREIAILEIARIRQSNYEFVAHASVGKQVGLSDEEIESLRVGSECTSLSESESLIRSLAGTLSLTHDLDDDLYARAEAELGIVVLADVVILVGFYEYTALALQVFRVPLPEGVASIFPAI